MAKWYDHIIDEQADLIKSAPLFFVATADPDPTSRPADTSNVNVSPKGGSSLHILDANHVAYLDYTGSGNETARHSIAGGPITVMVCSFDEENAAIVRLYGTATVTPLEDSPIADQLLGASAEDIALAARQVVDIIIERTQTSCGYGVPVMTLQRERTVSDRGKRYKQMKPAHQTTN